MPRIHALVAKGLGRHGDSPPRPPRSEEGRAEAQGTEGWRRAGAPLPATGQARGSGDRAQDGGGPSGGPFVCSSRRIAAKGAKLGQRGHAPREPSRPISCLHFLPSHRGSPRQWPPRSQPIGAALRAPPTRGTRGRGKEAAVLCSRPPPLAALMNINDVRPNQEVQRRQRFGAVLAPPRSGTNMYMHELGGAKRGSL